MLVVHGVCLGVVLLHVLLLFLAVAVAVVLISVLRAVGFLFFASLLFLLFLLLPAVLFNEVLVLVQELLATLELSLSLH